MGDHRGDRVCVGPRLDRVESKPSPDFAQRQEARRRRRGVGVHGDEMTAAIPPPEGPPQAPGPRPRRLRSPWDTSTTRGATPRDSDPQSISHTRVRLWERFVVRAVGERRPARPPTRSREQVPSTESTCSKYCSAGASGLSPTHGSCPTMLGFVPSPSPVSITCSTLKPLRRRSSRTIRTSSSDRLQQSSHWVPPSRKRVARRVDEVASVRADAKWATKQAHVRRLPLTLRLRPGRSPRAEW